MLSRGLRGPKGDRGERGLEGPPADRRTVPEWVVELKDDVAAIGSRLSRIEGGLALAGVLAGILVVLIAAHVIRVS